MPPLVTDAVKVVRLRLAPLSAPTLQVPSPSMLVVLLAAGEKQSLAVVTVC